MLADKVVGDLYRQFEFVPQRSIGGTKFGDLYDEGDPKPGHVTDTHIRATGAAGGPALHGLPDVTTVTGGGYFFLPSLTALHFIAGNPQPQVAELSLHTL